MCLIFLGSYEVLFDDGFVKVLKAQRISKSSPLFDPIKSSKQDRREKKRKINVAQLFKKKPRMSHLEDKSKKSHNTDYQSMDISQTSNQEEAEPLNDTHEDKNWKIQ